jgi:hypothetical protein
LLGVLGAVVAGFVGRMLGFYAPGQNAGFNHVHNWSDSASGSVSPRKRPPYRLRVWWGRPLACPVQSAANRRLGMPESSARSLATQSAESSGNMASIASANEAATLCFRNTCVRKFPAPVPLHNQLRRGTRCRIKSQSGVLRAASETE